MHGSVFFARVLFYKTSTQIEDWSCFSSYIYHTVTSPGHLLCRLIRNYPTDLLLSHKEFMFEGHVFFSLKRRLWQCFIGIYPYVFNSFIRLEFCGFCKCNLRLHCGNRSPIFFFFYKSFTVQV